APLDPGGSDATDSGYARRVRLWRRGTAPDEATVVFEGRADDVAVGGSHDLTTGRFLASRAPDFHTSEEWFWRPGTDPATEAPRWTTTRRPGRRRWSCSPRPPRPPWTT